MGELKDKLISIMWDVEQFEKLQQEKGRLGKELDSANLKYDVLFAENHKLKGRVRELERKLGFRGTGSMEVICGNCGAKLTDASDKEVKIFQHYHFDKVLCKKVEK